MPRFFFRRTDGFRDERDDEGVELESLRAARVEAVVYAGALLTEEPEQILDGQSFSVEVTDAKGTLLFTVAASSINGPAVIPGSRH